MSDESDMNETVDIPILQPKKRGRKPKVKEPKTEVVAAPLGELDMFLDTVVASISRLSVGYEAEIKAMRIFLAAAVLKMGGKIVIGKDIFEMAGERSEDLKITDENGLTKITL